MPKPRVTKGLQRISERVGGALGAELPESRTVSKHRQIAQAATEVFIEKGYPTASVDEIALRAGVSKQTLYLHFGSKENLFLAVTTAATDAITEELAAQLEASRGGSVDLSTELHAFARTLARLVLRPEVMALRRLVMAEVARFPELGRTWFAHGPDRIVQQLTPWLQELGRTGDLAIEDPQLAAEQFNWLVLAPGQNKLIFGAVDRFTEPEIDRMAAAGVRLFLAAYQARPAGPGG
jgi:TetR/AcrR family transcriptional regulator, mexJK operon transcriptional repressor